jgi:hypothetical protein
VAAELKSSLVDIATERRWEHDPANSIAAARGLDLALYDAYRCSKREVLTPARRDRLAAALNVEP